ncbi:hypothetical protein PCANC_01016 [Puccinia coronata f. sp. avenae]|uniref:Uncharacterized protein n=1 Tax=Puccinia coronata f. sp. avenae TaxID=200324 RepID=A0A2N5W6J2_9BASI|nr:hypothetical protein PCANC_01016 [Puccinia coronata f. sp. avenae]
MCRRKRGLLAKTTAQIQIPKRQTQNRPCPPRTKRPINQAKPIGNAQGHCPAELPSTQTKPSAQNNSLELKSRKVTTDKPGDSNSLSTTTTQHSFHPTTPFPNIPIKLNHP